ncbi:MAG: hypothetical protein ACI4AN_08335 [Muribaculaceae bacterium]
MDIEDTIQAIIDQHRSIDFVESEFLRMLNEDSELKAKYMEWCYELGYSPKTGYMDYIEEILESQDSVWDSLTEFEDVN